MRNIYAQHRAEMLELKAVPSQWGVLGAGLEEIVGRGLAANVNKDGLDLAKAQADGYLKSATLAICTDAQARNVASVPWQLCENGKPVDDAQNTREAARINYPGRMSRQRLMKLASMHLDLCGNAIIHNVVAGSKSELNVLNPDHLQVRVADDPASSWYKLRPGRAVAGERQEIPAGEILHAMYINAENPFWGLSRLISLAPFIDYDARSIRHNLALVANHAVPPGAWVSDFPIDDATAKRLKERLVDNRKGNKAGENAVLGSGLKFVPMGLTPRDLDWAAGAKMAISMICAATQVTPLRFFTADSTYENLQTSLAAEWLLGTMARLEEFEGAFAGLLTPEQRRKGLSLKPDISGVDALTEDKLSEAQAYQILVNNFVPPEQAARELGFALEFPGTVGSTSWRGDNIITTNISEGDIAAAQGDIAGEQL